MASLGGFAKQKGVKYFLVSFVDLFGTMRAKIVPATAIDKIAEAGAGFAGFATWFDITPADPDVLVMADPETADSTAVETGSRLGHRRPVHGRRAGRSRIRARSSKRPSRRAGEAGYELKSGVECEFFLIAPDGNAISDDADTQTKPCYDQQALMRRYDVIAEICDCMIALGWKPYQNDHEDANGQFEMNWEYDSVLRTADRHAFFKYMVRSIAEKHGLRATFMPKPFSHLTGNGCHAHAVAVVVKDGRKSVRRCQRRTRPVGARLQFLGGLDA